MIMQVIMFTVMGHLLVLDVTTTTYATIKECEEAVPNVYVKGHGYIKDRWSLDAYCFKGAEEIYEKVR